MVGQRGIRAIKATLPGPAEATAYHAAPPPLCTALILPCASLAGRCLQGGCDLTIRQLHTTVIGATPAGLEPRLLKQGNYRGGMAEAKRCASRAAQELLRRRVHSAEPPRPVPAEGPGPGSRLTIEADGQVLTGGVPGPWDGCQAAPDQLPGPHWLPFRAIAWCCVLGLQWACKPAVPTSHGGRLTVARLCVRPRQPFSGNQT